MWVPYTVIYTQSDVSLYDLSNREIVWTASADTQSLDLDSIIGSVVQSGSRELIKSGLLAPR